MTSYDLIIIGFGKAGKTLASFAAGQGQHVALIEPVSYTHLTLPTSDLV